jgi:hypothetical protein
MVSFGMVHDSTLLARQKEEDSRRLDTAWQIGTGNYFPPQKASTFLCVTVLALSFPVPHSIKFPFISNIKGFERYHTLRCNNSGNDCSFYNNDKIVLCSKKVTVLHAKNDGGARVRFQFVFSEYSENINRISIDIKIFSLSKVYPQFLFWHVEKSADHGNAKQLMVMPFRLQMPNNHTRQ